VARWAAVVVNYEAGPLLTDAVRAARGDDSAGTVELVVVDNGSADGSVATLLDDCPDVQVVRAPGNVGYARAANLGTAATRAPIVAVLNSDTVVDAGAAQAMLARFDTQPRLGACGPRLKNPDGTDYPSARRMPSIPTAVMHGLLGGWWRTNPFTARYRQLDAAADEPRLVDWLSGAAIWLRRDALDDVGGWDEQFFMYLEDVDLCWRLRAAGWDVAYEPAAVVGHVQGASTARAPYRMLLEHHRSAWRFTRKRLTGARAVLLPLAAAYLVARGAIAVLVRALGRTGTESPPR
jgi:N-acetylglucosaminyl-diphospho-decaprenol L-rhamnosyltransferase